MDLPPWTVPPGYSAGDHVPPLTAAAQDARATALTALYREHALGLTRLAYVMLGNRAAAEDVVQEAFLGLHRRWQLLSQPQKALPYLRSSVLNGCRSVRRVAARPQRPRISRQPIRPSRPC